MSIRKTGFTNKLILKMKTYKMTCKFHILMYINYRVQ